MKYNSEYFSNEILKSIENWDIKNTHSLVAYLKDIWCYKNYFIEKWDSKKNHLILELHTGGHSANEDIISALEKHPYFWLMWWWKSERGGHFYFEIDYTKIGFKTVSDYVKEKEISRQYVSQNKQKFEWVNISASKNLIRLKNN